ncbi:MAG: DUF58 domain-containing protein [Fusobacteriaceae bacterium]
MTKEEIIKRVRTIEIQSDLLANEVFVGSYHSCFKGNGLEFSDIRRYAPGDDVKKIDWKVTAKQGRAYIKEFVEERELPIFLLIDVSGSNYFGKNHEKLAEIVGTLAFTANKNSDKVGAILFSDRIEKFIPLKKGKKHSLAILESVLEMETAGKKTDINQVLNFFNKVSKRKGIVFLISDFLDSGYEKTLKITTMKNDLVQVKISNRKMGNLPKGIFSIVDSETGEEMVVESNGEKDKSSNKNSFNGVEIDLEDDYIKAFLKFFKGRNKR